MKAGRRVARGQAAVEAALGTLVFVTVLVFGIHFAEIGYLSLKVTEAASFATWDATGRQHNRYSGGSLNSSTTANAVTLSRDAANDRYADWDGRQSSNGEAPLHVFTQANPIQVQCEAIGTGVLGTLTVGAGLNGVFGNGNQRGMSCSAEGQLDLINIGSFHDQESAGYFKANHVASGMTTLKICGTGRAWTAGGNGDCQGTVPIMLGDWALSDVGNNEANECDLYSCDNQPYKSAVETAFGNVQGPTGAGQALAAAVAGYGTDEGAYWFTFKGEESDFQQELGGVHAGDDAWTVTPGGTYEAVPEYAAAYGARRDCFLGFPCGNKYSSK